MSREVKYISNGCVLGKKITPQFKRELAALIYNNSSCLMVRAWNYQNLVKNIRAAVPQFHLSPSAYPYYGGRYGQNTRKT